MPEGCKRQLQPRIWPAAVVLALILFFWFFKVADYYPLDINLKHRANFFGVTFSTKFSEELGLDWREVYAVILDQLRARYIRIPVYWDEIEKEEGVFDFSNYDYLIAEGEKRNVKFIISVGRRVPRWPECHSPAWLNKKNDIQARVATLKEIRAIVERYRGHKSIEYWQVENEPFLGTFGVCPSFDEGFLKQEFELVRSLDDRKIIITGSGELGLWRKEAKIGDIFGTTLYRVVYNSWFGYVKYPLPLSYYKLKAHLAGLNNDRLMILELQAEPWVPKGEMIYLTEAEINKTMSLLQFKANIQYAIDLDYNRAYLWGVEWWYWQKKYGNPAYWDIATSLFY
ncbi:MAG: hypothetical protein WC523_02920 [Patescibacteria group bacterium]